MFLFCFRNSPTQIIKVVRDQHVIQYIRRHRSSCGGRDYCCRSRRYNIYHLSRLDVNPDRPTRADNNPTRLIRHRYVIILRF